MEYYEKIFKKAQKKIHKISVADNINPKNKFLFLDTCVKI